MSRGEDGGAGGGSSGTGGSSGEGGTPNGGGGTCQGEACAGDAGAGNPGGGVAGASGGDGGSGGEPGPSEAGATGQGGAGGAPVVDPRIVRYSFEEDTQGWISVAGPRPPDVLDVVERSDEAAHDGDYSLTMRFDGEVANPDPGIGGSWYGVYVIGNVPSSTRVTLWMMADVPGFTVEIFVQHAGTYAYVNVSPSEANPLQPNVWRRIEFNTPAEELIYMGVKLYSNVSVEGNVYLDHIIW